MYAPAFYVNPTIRKEEVMPAKVDGEKCTACEACIEACPSEAIATSGDHAKVDPDKCVDCGVCVDECPVEAISME